MQIDVAIFLTIMKTIVTVPIAWTLENNRDHWQAIADNVRSALAKREHVEPKGKRHKKS